MQPESGAVRRRWRSSKVMMWDIDHLSPEIPKSLELAKKYLNRASA
jgi:hypothetical protein